jgi:hypothetical protein
MVDRTRRLSQNAELARTEAYRFHEFASSEEEIEEWTQEVTCHRNRLTVGDTLRVENNLRQLVEEVEEEALEDDEDDDDDAADDEDDDEDDEDEENSDAYSDVTDEGFQRKALRCLTTRAMLDPITTGGLPEAQLQLRPSITLALFDPRTTAPFLSPRLVLWKVARMDSRCSSESRASVQMVRQLIPSNARSRNQ